MKTFRFHCRCGHIFIEKGPCPQCGLNFITLPSGRVLWWERHHSENASLASQRFRAAMLGRSVGKTAWDEQVAEEDALTAAEHIPGMPFTLDAQVDRLRRLFRGNLQGRVLS